MIKGKVCKIFVHHAALDDRIYYKEARTLKDAGYDVNMVCRLQCGAFTDMGGRPVGYPDENGLWDYNGITFYGISKRKGLLGKWKEYKDLVRVGVSLKASVYHCHDDDIALIAAVKIKNLLGNSTKLIWDIHEFYSVSWRDIPKYGVKSILLHFFTYIRKKAINCSDYLITANNVVRGQTLIFNRFKKVEVLENAPVLSIFKEQEKTLIQL